MPIFHLLLVALIQGITEFLPISSSGHLILLPRLTGLADQGLAIDVAAHVGTLGAVILVFRNEIGLAARGLPSLFRGRIDSQGAWLALCLAVATVPVVLAGLALKLSGLSDALRSTALVGWTTILFGLLLFWADRIGHDDRTADRWRLQDALAMGLAQVLALIPGTSRSGITITAGRRLGYGREDAARLSMLMSVPVIAASGLVLSADVIVQADATMARDMALAAVFSFGAALLALKVMFRLLKSVSFTPYVVYRLCLGAVLLAIAYG